MYSYSKNGVSIVENYEEVEWEGKNETRKLRMREEAGGKVIRREEVEWEGKNESCMVRSMKEDWEL